MFNQHVIQLSFSGNEHRSAEFYRGIVAKHGEKSLPNVLFWRHDNGHSICETPEIRWVRSYKGVSIVASEQYQQDAEESVSKLMALLLNTELNEFKVAKITREVNAIEVDDIIDYHADRVLYDANPGKVQAFLKASQKDQRQLLEDYLKAELIREAETWGVDESVFIENQNHIRITQVKLLAPVKVKDKTSGDVKRMISRYSFKFSMPIQLYGTWQVGRQRSKGYGMVRPDTGRAL